MLGACLSPLLGDLSHRGQSWAENKGYSIIHLIGEKIICFVCKGKVFSNFNDIESVQNPNFFTTKTVELQYLLQFLEFFLIFLFWLYIIFRTLAFAQNIGLTTFVVCILVSMCAEISMIYGAHLWPTRRYIMVWMKCSSSAFWCWESMPEKTRFWCMLMKFLTKSSALKIPLL